MAKKRDHVLDSLASKIRLLGQLYRQTTEIDQQLDESLQGWPRRMREIDEDFRRGAEKLNILIGDVDRAAETSDERIKAGEVFGHRMADIETLLGMPTNRDLLLANSPEFIEHFLNVLNSDLLPGVLAKLHPKRLSVLVNAFLDAHRKQLTGKDQEA